MTFVRFCNKISGILLGFVGVLIVVLSGGNLEGLAKLFELLHSYPITCLVLGAIMVYGGYKVYFASDEH